jgi:hypothetical protein
MNDSSIFRFLKRGVFGDQHSPLSKRRVKPTVEALEDRQLLSSTLLGGLGMFLASDMGIFNPDLLQPASPPVPAVVQPPIQAPVVVASTPAVVATPNPVVVQPTPSVAPTVPSVATNQVVTVDGAPDSSNNSGNPVTVNPPVSGGTATRTETINFGSATTDWSKTMELNQFNPSLGTLTGVDITNSGSLTSRIRVESLDNAPADITGTVAGNLTLTGLGSSPLVTATNAQTEQFHAATYDGTADFAGTSGQDFGNKSSGGTKSISLNSAADLAKFIGRGQIALTETAHATSSADGAGNLLTQINSTARANVTVVYHYTPAPPPPPPAPSGNPGTPTPQAPPPDVPLSKQMFLASSFRQFI